MKYIGIFIILLGSIITIHIEGCLNMRTYRDGEFVFHRGEQYRVVNYQGHGKYMLQSEKDSSWLFVDEFFIYE